MALIIQMVCHTVMLAEPWDIHSRCESITDEEALKALASGCGGLTSVVNLSDCISHLLCF